MSDKDELEAMFSGGGAPTFKFEKIGDSITGTIVIADPRQQRDFDTNELKFWDDGNKMMELVLTLQTTYRDATIEDDDGQRRVFVRGAMLTAMRQALSKAKVKAAPEVGARVTIAHTDLGEIKRKGFNAPKLFTVDYEAATSVEIENMFGEDTAPTVDDEALEKLRTMSPDDLAAFLAAK